MVPVLCKRHSGDNRHHLHADGTSDHGNAAVLDFLVLFIAQRLYKKMSSVLENTDLKCFGVREHDLGHWRSDG